MILDMRGDLTKQGEEQVLSLCSWESGLPDGKRYVILNLTDVFYINSAGIAVMIRLTRTGLKSGFHIFAYGISAHYQKLFRMVGLSEHLLIYPDEYAILQRIESLEDTKNQ